MSMEDAAVEPTGGYDIRLDGNRELRASCGMFGLTVTPEEVLMSIPDRYGHSTAYNFTHADWARIVELIGQTGKTAENR